MINSIKTSVNSKLVNEIRKSGTSEKLKEFLENIILEENAASLRDTNRDILERYKRLVEIALEKQE